MANKRIHGVDGLPVLSALPADLSNIHIEVEDLTEPLDADQNKDLALNLILGGAVPTTTAENDFQVGNGAGAWIKKTLAQTLAILGGFIFTARASAEVTTLGQTVSADDAWHDPATNCQISLVIGPSGLAHIDYSAQVFGANANNHIYIGVGDGVGTPGVPSNKAQAPYWQVNATGSGHYTDISSFYEDNFTPGSTVIFRIKALADGGGLLYLGYRKISGYTW